MCLVAAVHLPMQPDETHQQSCPRTRMPEDKKFFTREELPDLCNLLGGNGRDGATVLRAPITHKQDASSTFYPTDQFHSFSESVSRIISPSSRPKNRTRRRICVRGPMIVAIDGFYLKMIFLEPALDFAFAHRMLLLDIFVFGHVPLRVRHLYTAAETSQPARSVKPDRLPCAHYDGAVRADSTQGRPFDTNILPRVIKITFHMIIINIE